MSSYTYDIEQGEEALPQDNEKEWHKTSRGHKHHHHRKRHHHKHRYSHQQPRVRVDKMQPSHEKRGTTLNTSNGQDTKDDIVKDLTYLLSRPKQEVTYLISKPKREEHHDINRHVDSKGHGDYEQPLFKVHESEPIKNTAQGVILDETSVDSALEREQRAASVGPNVQPQKPRPSHPGAIRVHGLGEDSSLAEDSEFTVTAPTPDLERGIARDNETGLAVAKSVNEEEEPELATATQYDPAAKSPLYRSRKFKLYMIALVMLLLIVIATVVAVVKTGDDENPVAPTAPPTTSLERTYREQFVSVVGDAVNVEDSPQDHAAEWIMFEDPLGLSPNAPNLIQRYQMTLFYFLTTNNGEKPWRSCNPPHGNETDECLYIAHEFDDMGNRTATRWLSGKHECNWTGLFCDPFKNIISLQVSNQNITTALPTEISLLPKLQAISFRNNEFTGTIPEVYAKMNQLSSFELHYNMLTGTLPEVYWQASALQHLNVGSNLLSGTISTHVGTLNELKGLHLFENMFSGTIPTEIGNARNLSYVRLLDNDLVGELPSELGELSQLNEFWISENGLNGSIPSELGLISDMEWFDVYENQFSGTIPEDLYNLSQLFSFSIDKNRLTGTISPSVGQLSNLLLLQVSTNDFTGTIPSEVGNLNRAELMWFHKTRFTGTVPGSLCEYRQHNLTVLQADCNPPENPPVSCQCCSHCCNRDTGVCLATT
jgi:Leucine-rich repeat (LRR) protein